MTENHDYITPSKGKKDWHTPLNNNFEQIDADVAIRDIESNLSNYTPTDDQEFIATDSGAVYIGDGTNWNKQSRSLKSLDTDELFTAPAGARLAKDSQQSVASGTLTEVTWESATEFNDNAPSFGDPANNRVTIPNDDYQFARVKVVLLNDTGNNLGRTVLVPKVNASTPAGVGKIDQELTSVRSIGPMTTDWFAVSSGDDITVDFLHSLGSTEPIQTDNRTWISVEAI